MRLFASNWLAKLACFCLLGANLSAFALELSTAEREFVSQHGPVSFCVDPDWQPFEHVDAQGRHIGIAADLLALLAQRTGLTLQLLRTPDWPASLQASKAGRCQLMSLLNQTPERSVWLDFTQPLLTDENVLITREEHPFIADLAGLQQHTMALPKGTSVEERVRRDFPNIQLVITDTEAQALAMVSERKADLTMRALIVAAYTIKREGWFNLKIAGQLPEYGNQLRVGVVKGQPMLFSVLDKGVASITPVDRQQAVDRHITIQATTAVDYGSVWRVVLIMALMMLTSLFWLRKLKRANTALQTSEASLKIAKNAAEQTAEQQRMFIAMLSHEVRTPLTVVDTAAQVLQQRLQSSTDLLPLVSRIRRGSVRLTNFFDNCLTADRIAAERFSIKPAPVQLSQLVRWARNGAELMSTEHHIALDIEPQLPEIPGDATLLRILIANLLSNAVKYAPAGTSISVRLHNQGESVLLEVRDQGPGIAPDELANIFEKYKRGRTAQGTPGAGLGLALVKRIANLHHGTVRAHNAPEGGAVFSVELPVDGLQTAE